MTIVLRNCIVQALKALRARLSESVIHMLLGRQQISCLKSWSISWAAVISSWEGNKGFAEVWLGK